MAEIKPDPVTAVYFTDFTGQNYEYDDVADAYVAVEIRQPFHQPFGHIPRRWGNTHDGGGKIEWKNTKRQHRWNEQSCTHYH